MKERKPTDQEMLDAKIAPLHERWSPGREDPAIGMKEGVLRALADPECILRDLAQRDEGARRAVRLADDWKKDEIPGPELGKFLGKLISPKTVQNHSWAKTGPEGKLPLGEKKVTYDKWLLTAWLYERYFRDKKDKGKTLYQIAVEKKVLK